MPSKQLKQKELPQVVKKPKVLSKERQQKISKLAKARYLKLASVRPSEIAFPKSWGIDKLAIRKKGKATPKKKSLRKSLTPGTVVIYLEGKQAGKKGVFLKQGERTNELLCIGRGGPNRIHDKYVIATSIKLDISQVPHLDQFTDKLFDPAKKEHKSNPKTAEEFFAADKPKEKKVLKPRFTRETKEFRQAIWKAVWAEASKTPWLRSYLRARFTLRNGDQPHNLKF